jgi:predicted dehydrogenase
LKIGFIGGHGHHYLRGTLADKSCEIAVASDGHDPTAARRLWEKLGGLWFDDASKMLDTFKPAAASVGAVYAFNGDWVAAALERNIPVVSDKPIAASWDQLNRLKALTAAADGGGSRIVLTEFDFRARPEFLAARDAVRCGKIGIPILATGQKSYRFGIRPTWYADRASYGGTLLWVASHAVDVIPFVTGQRLVRAIGHGGNLSHRELGSMEDHVAALFVLSDGGTAIVHADFLRPAAAATHGDDRLRIAGSEGVLEVMGGRCRCITNGQPEVDLTDQANPRPIHAELLAALAGQPSDLFSTAESLATAHLLLQVREAVDDGRWVELAQSPS